MDDSDDYDIDEIVLDNQTLAVLDQEEQKYFQGRSLLASANLTVQPTNKRQKTLNGWAPGIGSISLRGEIYDDLPEISLQGDGSYGIGNGGNSASIAPDVFPVDRNTQALRTRTSSNLLQANPPSSRIYPQSSGSRPLVPHPPAPGNVPQRPRFLPPAERDRMEQACPQEKQPPVLNELQTQMLEVQQKLNELREEHSKIQLALKNALEVKLAKEGEVSILRKNIEKTSQNHAAQLAQIKSEKDKAESKQAQMQKEMKEEVERLRTQYMFKQQELESAIRKPMVPASVRAKKVLREFPSTPLAIPSAMSSWNRGGSQNVALRGTFEETPMRPSRLAPVSKASPSRIRRSPEKTRKSAMLPGFENAFETSTPLRSQQVRILDKGKGRIDDDSMVFGAGPGPTFSQLMPVLSQFQVQANHGTEPSQANSIPPSLPQQPQMNQEEMDVVGLAEGEDDLVVDEFDVFEPINWKAQLCRIILTHYHPSTKRITFQQLLGSSQFVNITNHFSSSCARILEIVANSSRSDDYQESIEVVSGSLLSILIAVSESQDFLSMAILFDLLSELVLSLPDFRSSLLFSRTPDNESPSIAVVDLLCKCILDHLDPNKTQPHREEFASGLISLLDSLCFRLPSVALEKVEVIARNRNVLMILFHPSQPVQLVERASRLLVLLSTHHDFSKILLNQPDIHSASGSDESVKNNFIERLCSHLIDPNRPQEAYKIHILVYFTQLSISHPDAHFVLITSYVLVPSLILYISHLTTPLWEDDGTLASSSSATTSLIQAINQSTLLLHHLIFRTDPSLNLRHKLQHAPHRPFNSINHIFIVTFGRLSYCEAPSWLEGEMRQVLEYLAEIARDILELVVDGPEGDSVWAAFQTEPDEESTMDEEEMEARLAGVDL